MRCAFLPLALIALLVAAGCAVGPNYEPPQTDAPDLWHVELMTGLAEGEGNLQTWWVAFDDPTLTSLIERAAQGSLDIHQAVARVDEARARRGIARGEWFPGLDSSSTYQRNRISEEVLQVVPPGIWNSGLDSRRLHHFRIAV